MTVLWDGDTCEPPETKWDGDNGSLICDSNNNISTVTTPSRLSGKCSHKFVVLANSHDCWMPGSTATERTENLKHGTNSGIEHEGDDHWYVFSMHFPSEWTLASGKWCLVTQFHNGGPPHLAITVKPDGDERICLSQPNNTQYPEMNIMKSDGSGYFKITKDTWIDVMLHVLWSQGSDGFIELWIKDATSQFQSSPNTLYSLSGSSIGTRRSGANLITGTEIKYQHGIYRSSGGLSASTIYHQCFQVSDTRADAESKLSGIVPCIPVEITITI